MTGRTQPGGGKAGRTKNERAEIGGAGRTHRRKGAGRMRMRRAGKAYAACLTGMIVLMIAALLGPQIAFAVQDHYHVSGTEVKAREKLDVSKLNMTYEKDLYTRMSRFAQGGPYYATLIDSELPGDYSEIRNVIATSLTRSPIWMMVENSMLTDDILFYDTMSSDNILKWEKYIIFGDDFRNGVSLMVRYIDYRTGDGTEVQLVSDVETDTLYYIKVTVGDSAGETSQKTDKNWPNRDLDVVMQDFEPFCQYYSQLCVEYYDTEEYRRMQAAAEANVDGFAEIAIYDASGEIPAGETSSLVVDQGDGRFSLKLGYGDEYLDYSFQLTRRGGNYYPDITAGIVQIGELIPELSQK